MCLIEGVSGLKFMKYHGAMLTFWTDFDATGMVGRCYSLLGFVAFVLNSLLTLGDIKYFFNSIAF